MEIGLLISSLHAHTNGRLPLKLHTTVKEGVNLEKKLFTVLVYARGLIGPVRVKFDQMAYHGFKSI